MLPERILIVCLAIGDVDDDSVVRLGSMLKRHMPVPFDHVCVSDRPRNLPSAIRTLDAAGWPFPRSGMRATVAKLGLFDPGRAPAPEFLYLDTSLVVCRDLTELLQFAFGQPHELVAVRNWHYDAYNTSVMRIRTGGRLAEVPVAYQRGERFDQRVQGDQDYLTGLVRSHGWEDSVITFPDEMVQSYKVARRACRRHPRAGYEVLRRATIVKFHGEPKMAQLLSFAYRLRQALEKRNPFHRNVWFWVRECRAHWR